MTTNSLGVDAIAAMKIVTRVKAIATATPISPSFIYYLTNEGAPIARKLWGVWVIRSDSMLQTVAG